MKRIISAMSIRSSAACSVNRAGLVLLAALAVTGPAAAQTPATPPTPAEASTIVTSLDQGFFQQIRQAIIADNQVWLSSVIAYPLKVKLGGRAGLVHNATEFQRNYALIIDSPVRQAITLQDAGNLTKTLAGVSIGGGAIWFRQMVVTANGMTTPRMLVTAINN